MPLQASSNPCAASPCGAGTCQASPSAVGGYVCASCPPGFQAQPNPDGSQTCAANACANPAGNPCGPGTCSPAPSDPLFGYTCSCPAATVLGQNTDGSPVCVASGTGGGQYVVKAGDICWNIAIASHLTLDAFLAINQGIDCQRLFIGQVVNVGNYVPNPSCTKLYSVVAGDTCYALQQQNGLSDAAFQALNPGTDCNNLPIGCVPRPPPVVCCATDAC